MKFLENMTPDIVVDKVEHLVLSQLEKLGFSAVKAIVFDVDGTLTDYHAPEVEPEVSQYIKNLGATGVKIFIASNAHGARVEELNRMYGDGCGMTVVTPEGVYADGVFAAEQVKAKPAPDMLLKAWELAGLAEGDQMLMVGDQMFKDVYAARGMKDVITVLVPRRGQGDHPGVKVLQRPAEALLRAVLPGVPGRLRNFPSKPQKTQ